MNALHCKECFSRRAYIIRARSFKWFVANALSVISIIHSTVFIEGKISSLGNRNEWTKNLYVINFCNCGSS